MFFDISNVSIALIKPILPIDTKSFLLYLTFLNFVHTLDINRSIVVIGQAGERDYLKRPKVGEVVVKNASYAIFTYEDPRSEDQ